VYACASASVMQMTAVSHDPLLFFPLPSLIFGLVSIYSAVGSVGVSCVVVVTVALVLLFLVVVGAATTSATTSS